MSQTGFRRNFAPLNVLTENQLDDIHQSILEILENTGLRIEHEKALKLLKDNGCKIDFDNRRAKFPPSLVGECLLKCPRSFRIKARNQENEIILGNNTLYFGTNPGMRTVDLDTWEPRPPTKKEYHDALVIADALDNPHITMNYYPWFGWEGLPPVMCIPEGFAARIRNTSKPLCEGHSNDSEIFTIAMAKAVGAETIMAASSSPPLTWDEGAVQSLYRSLQADFPVRFGGGETMGATSPATTAGTMVSSGVTIIGRIVLAQLIKPGARIAVSPWAFPQNMRSGLAIFGSIQQSLYHAATSQYWRWLGIPLTHLCGFTNSKSIDFQCAYERTMTTVISALCGADVIQLCGAIFAELTLHPIQIILDDDIANMVGRFLEGVTVNTETLAVDVINEVGPIPGMYLDREHTRKWWKQEQFIPKAADTMGIPEWIATGKKNAMDYAKDRIDEILASYKPEPLMPKQEEDIARILKEAREYYRKRDLL